VQARSPAEAGRPDSDGVELVPPAGLQPATVPEVARL